MKPNKVVRTKEFQKAWRRLAPATRTLVNKKIRLLIKDSSYPSLQVHRLHQAKQESVWIAYISTTIRLIYQYVGNTIYLLAVGKHSILDAVHQRTFSYVKQAL